MAAKATVPVNEFADSGTPVTRPSEAGVPAFAFAGKRDTPATPGTHAASDTAEADQASPLKPTLASKLLRVRAWLSSIGENDESEIERVLQACLESAEVMDFHLRQVQPNYGSILNSPDERRKCVDCANFEDGFCMAANRGEINAARTYQPMLYVLQRCNSFVPFGTP